MKSPKRTSQNRPAKINLISMPWALFNRPSIQLGTLKAYLESRSKKLLVETHHPYLEVASIIGPELYHWISQNPWVSEALYAPLVFPEQAEDAEYLALKYARKAGSRIKHYFHFNALIEKLEHQLTKWVNSCDWTQYTIIGFSVCFHQLFASLAAAAAIKKKHRRAIIVFGGSSCCAAAGQSLLNTFHFVDYVIDGEGEKGLLALYDFFSGPHSNTLPGNVLSRQTGDQKTTYQKKISADIQLTSLEDLPVPDYTEYFLERKKWFPLAPFIPIIPIEFSRGCWWNKCAFCNLNLQWLGYRRKNAEQMLHEVKTLADRHACLDFTFTDNMLPPKEALQFFKITGADRYDFNFFAEIRSAKGKQPLADIFSIFRHGGLSTIQVGIEALSSSLLKKMRKGVSVIENIATMRGALENSLKLEGNLILHFPDSGEDEVIETLRTLDYVFPYRPLAIASFFLGFNSPVYNEPQKYGIKAIVNHPNNFKLFPQSILTKMNLLVKDYKGDRIYQRKIWKPVFAKVKEWQQYHANRKPDTFQKPLLYYRQGDDFLLIRQELPNGKILHHRLKGTSRQLYLFCTHIREDKELFERFHDVPPKKILSFLADLEKKRILFSEKNKYLSLAIHFRD